MDTLIIHFGYLAVLIGTFLEGETILILAGLAAHRGYLSLPLVILSAFLGTLIGDQLYFFLGRRHSELLLKHRPAWRNKIQRVDTILHRYHSAMILSFRFLYGLRTVAPFVIGMSSVPAWKYILFNVTGAAVWAVAVGYGGYFFGQAVEILLGDIKHYEIRLFIAVGLVGAGFWISHFYRKLKDKRNGTPL